MKEKKQVNSNKLIRNRAVVALLLVCLIVSMMPNAMAERKAIERKTAGKFEGTKWSYNTKTKTLTLSCKGRMDDERVNMYGEDWPWQVWGNEMEKIVVKEGVTYVGYNVTDSCGKIKSVSLPKSLKQIGCDTFSDTKIKRIILPSKLKKIEAFAFSNTKLIEVVFPQNVTSIEKYCFIDCKKLVTVQLPSKLEKISDGVFCYCSKLKTITLPKNITSIGEAAFSESGLTAITIPKKVTRIKAQAFQKCTSLKKVTFQTNQLTSIDASLFEGCKKLTTITLPAGITKLKEKAFKESGLTAITIPEKVTAIGGEAFAGCKDLKEVVFSGNQITSIGSNAFFNIPADCVFKVPVGQAETMKAMLSASGLGETVVVEEY